MNGATRYFGDFDEHQGTVMTDQVGPRSNFFKDGSSDVSFYNPATEQIDIANIVSGAFVGDALIGQSPFLDVNGNPPAPLPSGVDVVGRGNFFGAGGSDYVIQSADHTTLSVLDINQFKAVSSYAAVKGLDPNFEVDTFNGRTALFGGVGAKDGILLHNTVDGRLYDITFLHEATGSVTSTEVPISQYIGNIDPGLKIVATGDFEGFNDHGIASTSGQSFAGLTYQYDPSHSDDILAVAQRDIDDAQGNVIGHKGDMVIFTVVNGAITGSSAFVTLGDGHGWEPLYAGDFDYTGTPNPVAQQAGLVSTGTDGAADLVVGTDQDSTGASLGTDASGDQIMHYGVVITDANGLAGDSSDQSPPSATDMTNHWIDLGTQGSWKIVGIGDYNGDGVEDILWQDVNVNDVSHNQFAYTDMKQADQGLDTAAGVAAAWHDLGLALSNNSYHLIG